MQSSLPKNKPRRSVIRRLVRIFLKIVATIIIILVLVIFLIQTPYVQDIIRGKAEKYLARKLHTRVKIGNLYIKFPENIVLKNIYLEDRQKDTLLAAGLIDVNIHMWGLLHSNIDIGKVQLEGITMKVKRLLPDTAFNFQFIADAFSSPGGKKPAKTDTSSMKMSLRELQLDKVRLVYKDAVTGNDMEVWIDHSQTQLDAFDPTTMRFHVSQFQIKGLQAKIRQSKPLVAPTTVAKNTTGSSAPMDIQLGKIELVNSQVDYSNGVTAMSTNLQLGRLAAEVQSVDLDKMIFRLKTITVDSTNAKYDDNTQRPLKKGIDYAHLDIRNLMLHGSNLLYSADSISGDLTRGQFTERSGFQLVQLQTGFVYTAHQTALKGLLLRTPGTLLQRDLTLRYSSPTAMVKDPAHTLVDLDLPDSRIQLKDVLLFVPSLASQPAFSHPNDIWKVDARVKGNLDALQVERFRFSGLQDIRLDLSGTVLHPMDVNRVAANLKIGNVSGTRASLLALLPKGSLPANIAVPARFSIRGKLQGGMTGFTSDLMLTTSSGAIVLKGYIQQFRDAKNARYDLALQTRALDLGYILKDTAQWGRVTANFTAKGRGFDPQTANAVLHGALVTAQIRGYNYRNFLFDGSIANKHLELQSSIHDSAVSFTLKASGEMANKFPALKLDWQIDTVDLHALHFVTDTLQFKGHLNADIASTNPDSLMGRLRMDSIKLLQGTQLLATDSILLIADRKDAIQDIQLHTEMADVDWNGRYKLTEVARALRHTVNNYYRLNGFKDSAFTAEDWKMQLHFKMSPLALSLMPSLKGTDTIGALLSFNSQYDDLRLNLAAPHVEMGTQVFQNLTAKTSSGGTDNGKLRYSVDMSSAQGSGFALYQTSLHGWLAEDKLFSTVLLKDKKGKDRYELAGQLEKLIDGLKFTMNPDSLMLNYEKWQVSQDNYFQYDSAGILIHDFKIDNKGEALQVNSSQGTTNSPIDVVFTNFSLGTLSRFADQDSLLVDGTLDGKAEVKNPMSSPVFTSDLQIKNLSYRADSVGDLIIKVNNEKADALAADIQLKGHQNDVEIKGEYDTKASSMDMRLDLRQLNMASLKPFVTTQVTDIRGFLKGSLAIKGSISQPSINGNLHFDSTLIVPVMTGEPLTLSRDNIEFDSDGFNFSEFTLLDSAGNKLTVDGNVFTKDYKDYKFDITLNAHNFRLVNAQAASDKMFYGKLNLEAAANLTGDMNAPKVDGELRVNRLTNFTFVLPENNPEIVDRLGVVRFMDKRNPGDTLVDMHAKMMAARNTSIKGMDLSLAIATDSSAQFTIVIDERNGDALQARGRSNLVFGMDKSGRMELTGGFEVENGAYNLSFNVLKRKFEIQRGSSITWTGDPTAATLDITANYTANTPSIDLIANEIAGRTPTEINKFKQKLPFLVTLKMEGELLKPKITFDIGLPTSVLALWPDVDQKLQQIRTSESELDKQVFALLLLNRFVGEDPLSSAAGGGSSVGSLAFQSASQILTNQLDQLAGSLIKGVDIHFDLNQQQDFSTGTEQDYTELNVSVSKQLFNDRIQVSVGSNFDVQGTGNPNQQASNIAGDVAVDYKLTKDGRYMMRAYRKNQYQAVVEGQVVETGVSFILTFDYNRFREIFGRTKEEVLEERRRNKATTPQAAPQQATPQQTTPKQSTQPQTKQ